MSAFRKLLFPFSILYDGVTTFRNKLFDGNILKATKFEIPVVVVGNLSVGGTGKTPQIEYLIRLLRDTHKIAVLSRGYKRKSKGFLVAGNETTVEEIGDEPFQFFSKFKDICVAVDENRARGIKELSKLDHPPEVVFLDDAYQHRKVKGTVNILLTSYNDLYVDDLLLPAGNLRESKRGANRASIIIVTKCPNEITIEEREKIQSKLNLKQYQQLFFTTIKYAESLRGTTTEIPLESLNNCTILLITGIANPMPLVSFLETKKLDVTHIKYTDHHDFTELEITEIKGAFDNISAKNKVLLTTEKDFMRLKLRLNISYIQIESSFINRGDAFDKLIKSYVE